MSLESLCSKRSQPQVDSDDEDEERWRLDHFEDQDTINFTGPITTDSVRELQHMIMKRVNIAPLCNVHVYINSPGGDLCAIPIMESFMENLRQIRSDVRYNVTTRVIYHVLGQVASAAVNLICTGDKCYLQGDARILIHSCKISTIDRIQDGKINMFHDAFNSICAKLFSRHGKYSSDDFLALLNSPEPYDYIFIGENAIRAGLVDGIIAHGGE